MSNSPHNKQFAAFITAGDPSMAATRNFTDVLTKHCDIIEIGLPFSDPVADGATIQAANIRAMENNVTVNNIFEMLKTVDFEKKVILTYLNPVFAYGYEAFFETCSKSGVYGVIIPDLPLEERGEVLPFAEKYGIHLITLIAPTSAERVQTLAKTATGFIYLVSSKGVTGVRTEFKDDLTEIIAQIKAVTNVPVLVGFGISTPEHVKKMNQLADGVIVGSALVKIIEEHGENAAPFLEKIIKELRYV
jgi:tryptophan synthase alpha chain